MKILEKKLILKTWLSQQIGNGEVVIVEIVIIDPLSLPSEKNSFPKEEKHHS